MFGKVKDGLHLERSVVTYVVYVTQCTHARETRSSAPLLVNTFLPGRNRVSIKRHIKGGGVQRANVFLIERENASSKCHENRSKAAYVPIEPIMTARDEM